MNESGTYKIRPAGRHILTIGSDLIQDRYAAVLELVKNSYDADSSDVTIEFKPSPDNSSCYIVIISDHGHGMSRDTVINNWMVPSTRDKLERRVSPGGRLMQGRKGVGRYAASILGKDLFLETITPEGEKTTVYIEWKHFEAAQYLDDVDILIDTVESSEPQGTRITMKGDNEFLTDWNQRQFDKLRYELKKLKSPVYRAVTQEHTEDDFTINLSINDFQDTEDIRETVEPYPLFDLFDYRVAGTINPEGKGTLIYSIQKVRNAIDEEIPFDGRATGCGELTIDIRVYDREKEAIDSLIGRGLKDDSGNYVGKNVARQLLNKFNGIGVYRNGFRIRPLGDADFDWLKLNEQRVQNPSLKIGSNQAIGLVQIQSEELSGLIEKSARDGLKENSAFDRLKEITQSVISILETRRFDYRRKVGLSRPALKIERELEQLMSFDQLKRDVRTQLDKGGIDQVITDQVIEVISKDEEDKNKVTDEIRQAVAIYQGQATLGKIMNVVLHEGRRPLSYFRNQIPNIEHLYDSFQKYGNMEDIEKIMSAAKGIGQNAEVFVKLFNRLDPLAAGKRAPRKTLMLKKMIKDTFDIFQEEMKSNNVSAEINGPDDFEFLSWPQDIYAIFANLIDNSLYWMNEEKVIEKKVSIEILTERNSLLYIDYRDTGTGIEPKLIESEVIFEPQFSTKPSGTGLGLAIAGEAAARNGLELKAFESKHGAWFRLQPKTENEE